MICDPRVNEILVSREENVLTLMLTRIPSPPLVDSERLLYTSWKIFW